VDNETMTGSVKFGDFGEFPFTAKRGTAAVAPPAASAAPAPRRADTAGTIDASGKWDIVISLEGLGELPVQVDFKQEGTKLTGTFAGPTGEITLQGTMTGSALRMEFV